MSPAEVDLVAIRRRYEQFENADGTNGDKRWAGARSLNDMPALLTLLESLSARVTQAETTSRFEDWARSEEDFTESTPWDYREGFRDAQKVALGLVEAWKTPEATNG